VHCLFGCLQHANNVEPLSDALLRIDTRTQRRRDRMLAASVQQRIPDVMMLGSVVAAATAIGGGSSSTSASMSGSSAAVANASGGGWDDVDYYFHSAIAEGHWLAMLTAAGLLNDTVGLGNAHSLFTQHAIVLRVSHRCYRWWEKGLLEPLALY
jgi:hypothetical protein